jgi:HEAT repeat protein
MLPILLVALAAAHPTETVSAKTGLAREFEARLKGSAGPFWMGYDVPAVAGSRCSCGDGDQDDASDDTGVVRVLYRAAGGKVERIRASTGRCSSPAPLVLFTDVSPEESVHLLEGFLEGPAAKGAVPAIALHDVPAVDPILERLLAPENPLRKEAAFWLGEARGERGTTDLVRLVKDDPLPSFREHVIFCLTLSRSVRAIPAIAERAHADPEARVRSQALFWLGQKAGREAEAAIDDALRHDPNVEVKKKAVFALSQLPGREGVPLLIRASKDHPEVRKEAIFWLGQSQDPRALAYFEEILGVR